MAVHIKMEFTALFLFEFYLRVYNRKLLFFNTQHKLEHLCQSLILDRR